MRVAIIGGRGLLGQDLQKEFARRGWEFAARAKEEVSATDARSLAEFLRSFRPAWVVNCAAYVAVDDAEREVESAYELNETGAKNVAEACVGFGCRLVQVSTDYVFDGEKTTPYLESDETNPLGVYAKSKLAGETAAMAALPSALIARTAWLYGIGRDNFPLKILRAALDGKDLRLVADRVGSPTYTPDLARGLADLIACDAGGGIYNVVNEGEASWFDLCKEVIEYAGLSIKVERAANSDYPTMAARPMYSVLSTAKLRSLGIEPLPHWRDAVRRFVDALRENGLISV
jgi:dTDP-4-dehydrorhamnose reductase